MYIHLKSDELMIGDHAIHCGVVVVIADIEIVGWIVNVATDNGGRVSYPVGCRVRVIRK